jgi:hypothetical protein
MVNDESIRVGALQGDSGGTARRVPKASAAKLVKQPAPSGWLGVNTAALAERQLQTRRAGAHLLPADLDFNVLYQRQYAFEWLYGIEAWDDVQCDA